MLCYCSRVGAEAPRYKQRFQCFTVSDSYFRGVSSDPPTLLNVFQNLKKCKAQNMEKKTLLYFYFEGKMTKDEENCE